jgi:hypothetical protein
MPGTPQDRRYVIFAGPEQHGGASRFIAEDGKAVTDNLRQAANFLTYAEAVEFAKQKNITLNEARYIGLADFTARRT